MAFEFDHVFVFVGAGAPDADILAAAGLVEGASNIHPGQGTQNRRFFFQNGMIELLWVHSEEEASSASIARARLLERFQYKLTGACPFGIGLSSAKGEMKNIPFNTRHGNSLILETNWALMGWFHYRTDQSPLCMFH